MVEVSLSDKQVQVVIDQVLGDEHILVGQGDDQGSTSLSVRKLAELQANSINNRLPQGHHLGRGRYLSGEHIPSGGAVVAQDRLTIRFDRALRTGQCVNRGSEFGSAEEVVRVGVCDVDAGNRLAERGGVLCGLCGEGNSILGVG